MRIIRAPRNGHFTIVPNETARDRDLTYRALGLLVELLSHEDGWETSADRIAARAKEGRDAIRKTLSELEDRRYLLRKKERSPQGRWDWTWFIYDVPQPADQDPDAQPTAPVDNSPATPTPATPVDNARTNSAPVDNANPQVSTVTAFQSTVTQTTDIPSSAEPSPGNQTPAHQPPEIRGRSGSPHKEAPPQNTIEKTPPPTPSAPAPGSDVAPDTSVEEGIGDVLRLIPSPLLPRSKGQMEAFREALAPYLAAGWSPEAIAARAGYEPIPEQVHSPAGFLRQRLANLRLDEPASRRRPPWCGECDETNRWRENPHSGQPFKCPECHPAMVAPAQRKTGPVMGQ